VQVVSHGTGGVSKLELTLGEGEAAAAALRAAAPAQSVARAVAALLHEQPGVGDTALAAVRAVRAAALPPPRAPRPPSSRPLPDYAPCRPFSAHLLTVKDGVLVLEFLDETRLPDARFLVALLRHSAARGESCRPSWPSRARSSPFCWLASPTRTALRA